MVYSESIRAELPADALVPRASNSKGIKLNPKRLLNSFDNRVDFELLQNLAGRSLVSAQQLERSMIVELCKFASLLEITEIASHHPLDGKIVVTAFFEASTRTRLSFESAVLRLDGKIVSVPDGKVTGAAKGESLADIGEMLNTYGDLVVIRHPTTESVPEFLRNLQIPLINAGNGSGEHPTQALLDWYTILKWKPELARIDCTEEQSIHIGIIGTPGNMRAVKSFLYMALAFPAAIRKVTVISEMADPLGQDLESAVKTSSIQVDTTNDILSVIEDLDLIYMNSIALLGDSYRRLDCRYKLHAGSPIKEGAAIMHPFARNDELDTSLDETEHNLYFAQAAGAVFLRQALMIAVLNRISHLPTSIRLLTQ